MVARTSPIFAVLVDRVLPQCVVVAASTCGKLGKCTFPLVPSNKLRGCPKGRIPLPALTSLSPCATESPPRPLGPHLQPYIHSHGLRSFNWLHYSVDSRNSSYPSRVHSLRINQSHLAHSPYGCMAKLNYHHHHHHQSINQSNHT